MPSDDYARSDSTPDSSYWTQNTKGFPTDR